MAFYMNEAGVADLWGIVGGRFSGLGNEYVWEKTKVQDVADYDVATKVNSIMIPASYAGTYSTVEYGTSFSVVDGAFVINDPAVLAPTFDNYQDMSIYDVLKGKYFRASFSNSTYLSYAPNDATFTYTSGITISTVDEYSNPAIVQVTKSYGYVNSPDPNAYPIDDGFTYVALGQLGTKVQIATGTYEATGTYGSNNPNSLTFDFAPKIFAIAVQYSSNNQNNSQIFVLPKANGGTGNTGGSCSISTWEYTKKVYTYASADGKTVYWYSADNATAQMNQSGFTYAYFAIG